MRRSRTRRFTFVAVAALAATILMPPGPAAAATVIVDNATAGGFTASANWGTSAWSSQRYGTEYRFATPNTTASDAAWFRVNVPTSGAYLVEVWYPSDAGYNDSTPFIVVTTGR